ncbi:MAG TPA: class I SAM-dependent methyltransferase [Anaerolineaceae bacterium]|nr:class I SAM-dependent methyltransferase [Anaerolineaceae bacterium]
MTIPLRLSQTEIQALLREPIARDIPGSKRDEMAIPSYLHPNPLIRWLMWRRYEVAAGLAQLSGVDAALEFGCGIGLFLPTLAAACQRVYAIDIFPEYARRLSEQRHLGVIFPDRLDEIPDGALDLIVAADVLEHLPDVETYLDGFHHKLKPGGRLVVSGPTENLIYKIGRVVAGFGDKGDYHVSNIDLLLAKIAARGFRPTCTRNLPFRTAPHLFRVAAFDCRP